MALLAIGLTYAIGSVAYTGGRALQAHLKGDVAERIERIEQLKKKLLLGMIGGVLIPGIHIGFLILPSTLSFLGNFSVPVHEGIIRIISLPLCMGLTDYHLSQQPNYKALRPR